MTSLSALAPRRRPSTAPHVTDTVLEYAMTRSGWAAARAWDPRAEPAWRSASTRPGRDAGSRSATASATLPTRAPCTS